MVALLGPVIVAGLLTGGRLVLPCFDADPLFFLAEPLIPLAFRGFTRASTNAVAALDATFITASTFALAALSMASCAGVKAPFSLSIVASIRAFVW
jgi:hypothetical protein